MIGRGLEALTKPLADGDPCGPDLEAEDDDEYLNALVTAETVLPPDYYVADYSGARQPFDQDRRYKDIDLRALVDGASRFLDRTRDLRLYVLLAKLCILGKDLADTQICVEAVAVLLETQWDTVHPRGETGGYTVRREVLQRLDDPLIVTTLQHVPLYSSKRFGPVTWNRYLAEIKKAGLGDDTSAVDRVLSDEGQTELSILLAARDDVAAPRETLDAFRGALRRVRAVCAEHMSDGVPNLAGLDEMLEQLFGLLDRIYRLTDAAVGRIDPSAGRELPSETVESEAADGPSVDAALPRPQKVSPALASVELAKTALASVVGYFERCEPSSPALLLLRQAQSLIGKTFVEAMQILLPDHVAKAAVGMGSTKTFPLPLSRLAEAGAGDISAAAGMGTPPGPQTAVATRDEAIAHLEQIGAYFRTMEPSSPVPMLTDRARTFIGKDFMTLLGDLLPLDALKSAEIPKR